MQKKQLIDYCPWFWQQVLTVICHGALLSVVVITSTLLVLCSHLYLALLAPCL